MIQKPRGTFDILPEEMAGWHKIENKALEVAERFGFGEFRTPTFEGTELFQRGVGDTTDVVQKEMYTFTDRDGRSMTLRPEGTASLARCLIENGRCSDTMPVKAYYLINCFRYEKPQAGRSREFFQFGAEMYGSDSPLADANMIAFADTFIREIGIQKVSLHINSIGCKHCRPQYRQALTDYFEAHETELCETCRGRLHTNPLRILDCKSPICSKIAASAPKTIDHLCDDCKTHLHTLENALTAMKIPYEIDPKIVRGLDYYTRTVFEFICPIIGAQSTVCGGGRYDGLIEELGGPALPAIGFAAGITRLLLALKEAGELPEGKTTPKVYLASMGEAAAIKAPELAAELRAAGMYAECDVMGRSLKAQMKYANKLGAAYTLIIGDSELESGRAQLRNMTDSTQSEMAFGELVAYLQTH